MQCVLFIGSVFPESNSTAAGTRIIQLITFFKEHHFRVIFASAAKENPISDNLNDLGAEQYSIEINNVSFDSFIEKIDPNIVIFDRFISEEQFGWRVGEVCPNAIRILDTEDLHCLRAGRQHAFKKKQQFNINSLVDLEITKRELASIFRCDLSLIISNYEFELLTSYFKIPSSILCELPFMLAKLTKEEIAKKPSFENRANFISIGNFKHEPNWQSVLYLKNSIWPLIRQQVPKTKLLIYGAYATQKVTDLNNEKEGYIVKGRAKNAHEVIANAKVLVAPLQFGAGLKGKLIDAMKNGTPSVTTSIGAESMHNKLPWNGFIEDDPQEFANKAVELYHKKSIWEIAQQNGIEIINKLYDSNKLSENLWQRIAELQQNLKSHRAKNFIGSLLQHHTLQSTKYLSKWIEEKNK